MSDNKMSNAYEELAKYWWDEFGNEELDEIQIQTLVKQSCTFQDVSVTRGGPLSTSRLVLIKWYQSRHPISRWI